MIIKLRKNGYFIKYTHPNFLYISWDLNENDDVFDTGVGLYGFSGEPIIDENGNGVVHKGIASRQFIRSFALGEDIKVKNAKLENGLLTVDLEREIPEEKKPRLIEVH